MQLKNSYYFFKSAIEPEVCQKIIDLGTSKIIDNERLGISTDAYTFGDSQKSAMGPEASPLNDTPLSTITDESKKTYIRDSKIAWLYDQWLYDLIQPFIQRANYNAGWGWNYDLSEAFQFTQYNSPGGFYGWHKDGMSDWNGIYRRYIHGITQEPLKPNGELPAGYVVNPRQVGKIRKLSLTINLNCPGDYEGGNLKFDFGMHVNKNDRFYECEEIRPQGSMIVFPSFVDHCVTPITKGTRYSLVLWTLGDPWK
jgi:PKHD-type hydroxylase